MARRLIDKGPVRPAAEVSIPVDAINEQAVLVAALDGELRGKLLATVRSDEFVVREHAEIWAALQEVERRKLQPTPALLRGLCDPKAASYLFEVAEAARESAVPRNVEHHVAMLRWDRARFDAVRGPLAQLISALRDPKAEQSQVRSAASALADLFARGSSHDLLRSAEGLTQATRAERRERRERAVYPYGIDGLDNDESGGVRIVPGCAPGKTTVLTGVPGSGKTTIAAQIALAQIRAGRRVLYGAWEIGSVAGLELLATLSLGLSRRSVVTGYLTEQDETELALEEERLQSGGALRLMDRPRRAVGSHVARGDRDGNRRVLDAIHAAIVESGADVFVADLWKRALVRTDPDDEEEALNAQQAVCLATRCHGLLVQQQRFKDIEQRPDKRPTREGIKGSGAYVEIADTIIGVHRPALWKDVEDDSLELIVLKQRWGGRPQAIEFSWDGDFGRLSDPRVVPYDASGRAAFDSDDFLAPRTAGKRRKKKARAAGSARSEAESAEGYEE